jgi:hypothetical protein
VRAETQPYRGGYPDQLLVIPNAVRDLQFLRRFPQLQVPRYARDDEQRFDTSSGSA